MPSSESIIRPSLVSSTTLTAALQLEARCSRWRPRHPPANTQVFTARVFQPALGPSWKTSLPVRACPNRIARIRSSKAYFGNQRHTGRAGREGRRRLPSLPAARHASRSKRSACVTISQTPYADSATQSGALKIWPAPQLAAVTAQRRPSRRWPCSPPI